MSTLASVWIVYSLTTGVMAPVTDMPPFGDARTCEMYLASILTERTLPKFFCWPRIEELRW